MPAWRSPSWPSSASGEAEITDSHVKIGVAAGDHAAILWPLLCGMAKAKLLPPDDGRVRQQRQREAERIGLCEPVRAARRTMDKATAVANKLAAGSQQAIRLTKRSLNGWIDVARPIFRGSLAMEMLCFLGEDAKGRRGLGAREARAKFPRPTTEPLPG